MTVSAFEIILRYEHFVLEKEKKKKEATDKTRINTALCIIFTEFHEERNWFYERRILMYD